MYYNKCSIAVRVFDGMLGRSSSDVIKPPIIIVCLGFSKGNIASAVNKMSMCLFADKSNLFGFSINLGFTNRIICSSSVVFSSSFVVGLISLHVCFFVVFLFSFSSLIF